MGLPDDEVEYAFNLILNSAYKKDVESVVAYAERHFRFAKEEGLDEKSAIAVALPYIAKSMRDLFKIVGEEGNLGSHVAGPLQNRRKELIQIGTVFVVKEAIERYKLPKKVESASPERLSILLRDYHEALRDPVLMEHVRLLDRLSENAPSFRSSLVKASNELRATGNMERALERAAIIAPFASYYMAAALGHPPPNGDAPKIVAAWILLDAHGPSNDADWKRDRTRRQRRSSGKD